MLVGILFTVIVSLAIGTFSVLVCMARRKANPRFVTPAVPAYALFWLSMAVVWYLVAAIDFLGYFKLIDLASILIYIMQVVVGLSLIAAACTLWHMLGFTSKKGETVVIAIYIIFFCVFIWSLFRFGVQPQQESFFVSQIITSAATRIIFTIAFMPLLLAGIFLIFKHARAQNRQSPGEKFLFVGNLGLVLLGVSGFVDETGLAVDWFVTVSRLITLVSSILAYSAVAALQEPDELVI